jgi:hypothetical protein
MPTNEEYCFLSVDNNSILLVLLIMIFLLILWASYNVDVIVGAVGFAGAFVIIIENNLYYTALTSAVILHG